MPVDMQLVEALKQWEGKFVVVKVRQTKAVDASPGEVAAGYFMVEYSGDILSPAVRPFPENQPNGPLCLYIQTRDQQRKVFALDLNDIQEVDDEVKTPAPVSVAMSGLTTPGSA